MAVINQGTAIIGGFTVYVYVTYCWRILKAVIHIGFLVTQHGSSEPKLLICSVDTGEEGESDNLKECLHRTRSPCLRK